VKLRLISLLLVTLVSACSRAGILEDGGVYTRRSPCPLPAIPAGTGDITMFNPAGSVEASAIDVTATMTNLRSSCNEGAAEITSTASFDVLAVRRDPGPARQVVLPYFSSVVQAGSQVVAKRVGYVALNFAAGSMRAQASGQAYARVQRSATALPAEVQRALTRERRAGDPAAAIDPLADPGVRAAVARATFEHLVGFHLNQAQLRYNVTR
jgi:hypothetical protein